MLALAIILMATATMLAMGIAPSLAVLVDCLIIFFLRVRLAAEMPRCWTHSGSQIPLDDFELPISALDHKPMDRILADGPANLALEFLQTRHALSVER